jgi:hypothetical protein
MQPGRCRWGIVIAPPSTIFATPLRHSAGAGMRSRVHTIQLVQVLPLRGALLGRWPRLDGHMFHYGSITDDGSHHADYPADNDA